VLPSSIYIWVSTKEFLSEASTYLNASGIDKTEQSIDRDLIAKYENTIRENKAIDAGLRAVIRALLKELRIKAPESNLLDPEIRMKEYKKEYENEIKKNMI
jgi:hypothetical protein